MIRFIWRQAYLDTVCDTHCRGEGSTMGRGVDWDKSFISQYPRGNNFEKKIRRCHQYYLLPYAFESLTEKLIKFQVSISIFILKRNFSKLFCDEIILKLMKKIERNF